jgi:hypothetical protein
MGWETFLGPHTDPAQVQGVGGTTAPPTSTAPLSLLTYSCPPGLGGPVSSQWQDDIKEYEE